MIEEAALAADVLAVLVSLGVHGRIEAGFRRRLLDLLQSWSPQERQAEVARLTAEALGRASAGVPLPRALLEAYLSARGRLGAAAVPQPVPPRFHCDPSLAGLARWLHASGYEATVSPPGPASRAVEQALREGAILLTTATEALDRRVVATGALRLVWVPSSVTAPEQLRLVIAELGLPLREPRCMSCGGALLERPKDAVRDRIPPRTARWKDEYFVCESCGGLFWRGTHWERIAGVLRSAAA